MYSYSFFLTDMDGSAVELERWQRHRAQIEERIYGWGEEVESNAIDVLIHSIRRKFDKEIIRNVRGAGWMIVKSTQ